MRSPKGDRILDRIDFWRSLPLPIIRDMVLNKLTSRLNFLSSWIEGTQLVPAAATEFGTVTYGTPLIDVEHVNFSGFAYMPGGKV